MKPLPTNCHMLVLLCLYNKKMDLDVPKDLSYSLSKWPYHKNRKSRSFISSCLTQLCHHPLLVNNCRQVKRPSYFRAWWIALWAPSPGCHCSDSMIEYSACTMPMGDGHKRPYIFLSGCGHVLLPGEHCTIHSATCYSQGKVKSQLSLPELQWVKAVDLLNPFLSNNVLKYLQN